MGQIGCFAGRSWICGKSIVLLLGRGPTWQIIFNRTSGVSINDGIGDLINFSSLGQNYPNLFGAITSIGYSLPDTGGNVTLRIYDTTGRLVRTLVDEPIEAGHHSVI